MLCAAMPINSPTTSRRSGIVMARPLLWFIAVGCAAAALHWLVVVVLVNLGGWRPLLANVAGWAVALLLSFSGHHLLSFRDHGRSLIQAAPRFFLVSAGGFLLNEAAYAWLLHTTTWRFDLALAAVLVAVAVATYLLSRHWVFLRNPGP